METHFHGSKAPSGHRALICKIPPHLPLQKGAGGDFLLTMEIQFWDPLYACRVLKFEFLILQFPFFNEICPGWLGRDRLFLDRNSGEELFSPEGPARSRGRSLKRTDEWEGPHFSLS